MLAPGGAPTSENVSVWAGTSESVAVAVNVYGASSGMVALAGTFAIAGAALASCCVRGPGAAVSVVPSLPRTETAYGPAPGPCASLGVHVNTPLEAPMLAPAGAPTNENDSVCAGTSASVAVA